MRSMRAIGIVRVSRTKGEEIASPIDQRERIVAACEREGIELVETLEELDVSGGAALEKRPQLGRAVAMVEAGEVDTIVVSYFDRLVRSIRIQSEIVQRVEAAGGNVWTVDMGQITNGNPTKKLQANLMGSIAQYVRETTAERTQEAKRRAIADGVPTFDRIPPGLYRPRGADGKLLRVPLEHDPVTAAPMRGAWQKRSHGASIEECRTWLRSEHGVKVTYSQLTGIFRNRIYLGELHFGNLVNTHAHDPLVDPQTFARVQKLTLPRGRKPKSDRLLARLGVLRCGTCGAKMVVGQTRANGRDYPMYRCPPNGDCPRRVTISALVVEELVVSEVQRVLSGISGAAGIEDGIAEAGVEVERTENELSAAVQAFSGLDDVEAVRSKLGELKAARDSALGHLDELRLLVVPAVTVSADDWDVLTLDERRDLIRAVVERAQVAPGRGANRVTVKIRGE